MNCSTENSFTPLPVPGLYILTFKVISFKNLKYEQEIFFCLTGTRKSIVRKKYNNFQRNNPLHRFELINFTK